MARIGIMGGTFDPIHYGHLMLGEQAYKEYQLNQVWYMPSGQPPHKKDHMVTDASMRCEMVGLAIKGYPYFKLSDIEVNRKGNTYTAQTLKLLKELWPEHDFFFIIGADSLYELETWYHPEDVLSLATLVVAAREYENANIPLDERIKYLEDIFSANILKLHCTQLEVSSEHIRKLVKAGQSIDAFVPDSISDYVKEHNLYRKETRDE